MATFGKTATSVVETTTLAVNYKQGGNHQLTEAGSVTKLTAYLKAHATNSQVAKGLIYASSATPHPVDLAAGALLGTTNEVTIVAGSGTAWVDFPFAVPVDLIAGYYFLGLHAGTVDAATIFLSTVVTNKRLFASDVYVGGATNPFGATSNDGFEQSIYATYTPTVAGTAKDRLLFGVG